MGDQITTAMVDAGIAQLDRYLTGQIEPVSGLVVSLVYSAMLQASSSSGGVSGEDGELIADAIAMASLPDKDGYISRSKRLLDKLAGRLSALLAERDGLKDEAHYANGVADLAMKHRDEAETALAEVLRLLARLRFARPVGTLDPIWDELSALLAKHGKTEEAK